MTGELGQAFWDDFYRAAPAVWSGRPNPQLVAHAGARTPGRALDLGCGEGADAIWLAAAGWQVTAVDVSAVALERGARAAAPHPEVVRRRISWRQADLATWRPDPEAFELVSAQYLHLPSAVRATLWARLAAGVAPGGWLLVVAHHAADVGTGASGGAAGPGHRHDDPDRFYAADEILAALPVAGWEVVANRSDRHPRPGADHEVRDLVVLAARRA